MNDFAQTHFDTGIKQLGNDPLSVSRYHCSFLPCGADIGKTNYFIAVVGLLENMTPHDIGVYLYLISPLLQLST